MCRSECKKEMVVSFRDFTIVSGDSRGMTSFWNGHQGTLIKVF